MREYLSVRRPKTYPQAVLASFWALRWNWLILIVIRTWWWVYALGLILHAVDIGISWRLIYWKRELVKAKEENARLHREDDKRVFGVDTWDEFGHG